MCIPGPFVTKIFVEECIFRFAFFSCTVQKIIRVVLGGTKSAQVILFDASDRNDIPRVC